MAFAAALLCSAAIPESPSGTSVRYRLASPPSKSSTVVAFTLARQKDWLYLHAEKQNGDAFDLWLHPERYILREGSGQPEEIRNPVTGKPVLPSAVSLERLLPQAEAGGAIFLGHRYNADKPQAATFATPEHIRVVPLRPDLLIGPASNARAKDDTRRWDGSDYEMVRFTRDDYRTLADAGVSCVRVDDEQSSWAHELGLFYWGSGEKLPYPEMLFRPQYLGPALYLDEPAVSTRDHVLRPRLEKDSAFRRSIRPADAMQAFATYYADALDRGAPVRLQKLLAARADVDLGSLSLVQENLYSWETMLDTAAYELTRRPNVPEAFVFEPPGRIGSHRTLPELNMTAGTQYPAGDTAALADLLFSFLRGGARLAGKNWGVSIYGAVERADAPYWLTRAYDMGATRFHFWDNYQLACVPFREYLALARHLRNHADNHPNRDLARLRNEAEVAILLPAGYGLGHTHLGRGNLWGLPELNLERRNASGIPYRTVMSNFHLEAERAIRAGIPFDALWDVPGNPAPSGYREVVRIREDGRVEVESAGGKQMVAQARRAEAKPGTPPKLTIDIRQQQAEITAVAHVSETAAPVYYTHGTDSHGIYRNAMVLWELYGPNEEDYRFLTPHSLETTFRLDKPGTYRLRAATVDTAGRSTVLWRTITLEESAR